MSVTPGASPPPSRNDGIKSAITDALAKTQATQGLAPRQLEMVQALEGNAKRFGPFASDPGAANYQDGQGNPYGQGISCGSCVFFLPDSACRIVAAQVDAAGACRLYIIPAVAIEQGGVSADPGADPADEVDGAPPPSRGR